MIAGDGVVHCLPESLDAIDPEMVEGLEEQLEHWMLCQLNVGRSALVYTVVIEDEHRTLRLGVSPFACSEIVDEQSGIFAHATDSHELAGARGVIFTNSPPARPAMRWLERMPRGSRLTPLLPRFAAAANARQPP